MPATNALWGGKPGSARAKMIIPVFSSTPCIQNLLENAENWRLSNAKGLYWINLSLTQKNNETLPICFKRQFFFFQHYLLPFHPPQTQVQNDCTSPRHEGLQPCSQWHQVGDVLCPLSRNKAQVHSQHPQSSPQSFSPAPVALFLPQTATNPFVPTRSTLQQHHSPGALGELKATWRVDFPGGSSIPCSLLLSHLLPSCSLTEAPECETPSFHYLTQRPALGAQYPAENLSANSLHQLLTLCSILHCSSSHFGRA